MIRSKKNDTSTLNNQLRDLLEAIPNSEKYIRGEEVLSILNAIKSKVSYYKESTIRKYKV